MQTPAPVDYARAHSVEEALELLERYGPEVPADRRRAQPDPDDAAANRPARAGHRHQRPDRAGLHPGGQPPVTRHYLAIGAMTRHRSLLASRGDRRALHDPARRRAGDRRSDRPQPRHRRRFAVPGRSGRGPVRGRRGPARRRWSSGPASGSRTVPAREFTDGPYETVLDDAEMLVEVRIPIRPGAGSAYEKVERRAGDWAVASAGAYLVLDGDTVTDVGIGLAARRRRARLRAGGRGVPARQGSHRRGDRRGRPAGRRVQQSQRRPTRPGHLQEAPRRRTHPGACSAAPPPAHREGI